MKELQIKAPETNRVTLGLTDPYFPTDFTAFGLFFLQEATGSCILQRGPGAGPAAERLPALPER